MESFAARPHVPPVAGPLECFVGYCSLLWSCGISCSTKTLVFLCLFRSNTRSGGLAAFALLASHLVLFGVLFCLVDGWGFWGLYLLSDLIKT